MNYDELCDVVFEEVIPKIQNHRGLAVFARERAKFEGWLKVEIVTILSKHVKSVVPEKNRVDITFEDWAIELKTVNTNLRYDNVRNKRKAITKNTAGVVKDINKLRSVGTGNKAVIFVVFPATPDNENWRVQLGRIQSELRRLEKSEFSFPGGMPGIMYCGLV